MGVQLSLNDIQAAFESAAAKNANNTLTENALNEALDRTGSVDNAMAVHLDMGLNPIINLGQGSGANSAATVGQVTEITANIISEIANIVSDPDGTPVNIIVVEEEGSFYEDIKAATASQTVFTLTNTYKVGGNVLSVYVNGVRQVNVTDYTETDESTVTFLTPLTVDDTVQFTWSKTLTSVPTNLASSRSVVTYTLSAGVDTFAMDYNPGSLNVFLNGAKLFAADDYVAVDGTSVILTDPLVDSDDTLELEAFSDFSVANTYSKTEVYTKGETYNNTEVYTQAETYTQAEVDAIVGGSGALAVPVGGIIINPTNTVHTGFLECNGSAVSRTTYSLLFAEVGIVYGNGDGSTTFNLPDLRGEFVRGWDNGRGVDAARSIGSSQSEATLAHNHTGTAAVPTCSDSNDVVVNVGTQDLSIGTGSDSSTRNMTLTIANDGGAETRPRNIAMMYEIKY